MKLIIILFLPSLNHLISYQQQTPEPSVILVPFKTVLRRASLLVSRYLKVFARPLTLHLLLGSRSRGGSFGSGHGAELRVTVSVTLLLEPLLSRLIELLFLAGEPSCGLFLKVIANLESVTAGGVLDEHESAAAEAEGRLRVGREGACAAAAALGADALAAGYGLAAVLVDGALKATALAAVVAAAGGAHIVAADAVWKGAVARRAEAETQGALAL